MPAATVAQIDGECVITLHGEIDIGSADEAIAVAKEAISTCPTAAARVVVDMAGVTFLDSTGIGALVVMRNAGLERGIPTRLRNLPRKVDRVLQVAGLRTIFDEPSEN